MLQHVAPLFFFSISGAASQVAFSGGGVVFPTGFVVPSEPLNTGASPPMNCSIDFRNKLPNPPCKQETRAWCWATCVSLLGFYYNASITAGQNCSAVECGVLSRDLGVDCCPTGSNKQCDKHGGEPQEIANAAQNMTGMAMTLTSGIPTEIELQEILMKGKPVIQLKLYQNSSAGHAEIITGCVPDKFSTQYFVHDPETQSYYQVDYQYLVLSGSLQWVQAVYAT